MTDELEVGSAGAEESSPDAGGAAVDTGDGGDAALLAAVQAELAKGGLVEDAEGELPAPAKKPQAPAKPKEEAALASPPPPTEEEETELDRIRLARKRREDEQRKRELEGATLREQQQLQQQERERLRAEAREEALREFREKLRLNPVEAIRETGVEGPDLVKDIYERSTPNGKLLERIAALESRHEKELAALRSQNEQFAKAEEERQRVFQYHAEKRREAEFLAHVSEEKTPYTSAYFEDNDAILRRAYEIAGEYQAETNRPCPYPLLVQQLEKEARAAVKDAAEKARLRAERLSKLTQQVGSVTPDKAAPESKAAAGKPRIAPSPSGGERRSTPKPPDDEAEMEEAMLRAASEALGPDRPRSRMR